MKNIGKIIALVAACVTVLSAQAGSSAGPVKNIFMHTPGILMFSAGTTINGVASCASGTQQWAISLTDPAGKAMLAILLSAQAQEKSAFVQGYTNTCRDWGDRELPSYIVIQD